MEQGQVCLIWVAKSYAYSDLGSAAQLASLGLGSARALHLCGLWTGEESCVATQARGGRDPGESQAVREAGQ